MTTPAHGTTDDTGDAFSREERGETVPRPVRLLLLGGVLVFLLGATAAVVWGNESLVRPVTAERSAAAGSAGDAGDAGDDSGSTGAWPTRDTTAAARDAGGSTDAAAQVAALRAEDARLRAAVSGVPDAATLVLAPRPAAYGPADLVRAGALRADGATWTLVRSVVVPRGAVLDVAAPDVTLRMRSGADGFTSIVAAGGGLRLAGSPGHPLTLVGWDTAAQAPDTTTDDGRAYVRAKDGRLDVAHVAAQHLGFWSGRTGGIAATGTGDTVAEAAVLDLRASDVHLGLYLSGVTGAVVQGSAFERTEQTGIEVANQSDDVVLRDTTVTDAGRDGLEVSRGTAHVDVTGVTVTGAGRYGAFVDGTALADGPNSAGWGTESSAGLTVDGLTVRDADRGGVRVDSTTDVRLAGLDVAGSGVALDLRGDVADAVVDSSVLVGEDQPAARVTVARGVRFTDVEATAPATALLVEQGAEVAVADSQLRVTEGNAALAQGDGSSVAVEGGSVTGRGAGAVDARNGADATDTDVDASGWAYRPALLTWVLADVHLLLLLLLVPVPVVGLLFVRRRRRDQVALRRLFHEETARLGRERLAAYDAVVAARAATQVAGEQTGGAQAGDVPGPVEVLAEAPGDLTGDLPGDLPAEGALVEDDLTEPASVPPPLPADVEVPDSPAALDELEALGVMDETATDGIASAAPPVVPPVVAPAAPPAAAPAAPPVPHLPAAPHVAAARDATASMRAMAVAAVVEQGYRPSDVARSLGVPTSRVRGWVADRT